MHWFYFGKFVSIHLPLLAGHCFVPEHAKLYEMTPTSTHQFQLSSFSNKWPIFVLPVQKDKRNLKLKSRYATEDGKYNLSAAPLLLLLHRCTDKSGQYASLNNKRGEELDWCGHTNICQEVCDSYLSVSVLCLFMSLWQEVRWQSK